MSRVAKAPITVPKGVKVSLMVRHCLKVERHCSTLHPAVQMTHIIPCHSVFAQPERSKSWRSGRCSTRTREQYGDGCFRRFRLQLVGVGCRAQIKGSVVRQTVSHISRTRLPKV